MAVCGRAFFAWLSATAASSVIVSSVDQAAVISKAEDVLSVNRGAPRPRPWGRPALPPSGFNGVRHDGSFRPRRPHKAMARPARLGSPGVGRSDHPQAAGGFFAFAARHARKGANDLRLEVSPAAIADCPTSITEVRALVDEGAGARTTPSPEKALGMGAVVAPASSAGAYIPAPDTSDDRRVVFATGNRAPAPRKSAGERSGAAGQSAIRNRCRCFRRSRFGPNDRCSRYAMGGRPRRRERHTIQRGEREQGRLTASRIVSLAHAEVIGLDDPVSKYLPGVKLLDKAGVDQAGTITVRQLVQHRSGLPQVPKDLHQKVANRWSSPDLLRVLTDSWELSLEGTPGQYKYSNTGYALLAAIVERSRNCSFADCMASYLNELGMTRSTFWPATLGDDAAQGRVVVQGSVKFNAPSWYASRYAIPFTGLWTSMPELARFGSMLVAASKDPASPLHAMTTTDGATLGLFRDTRLDAPSLEHDGSGPGFHAAFIVVPSKDIVVALATNGGNETKAEGAGFTEVVVSAVNAAPGP